MSFSYTLPFQKTFIRECRKRVPREKMPAKIIALARSQLFRRVIDVFVINDLVEISALALQAKLDEPVLVPFQAAYFNASIQRQIDRLHLRIERSVLHVSVFGKDPVDRVDLLAARK